MRSLGAFFWFKFLNNIIFWGFQKYYFLGGCEDFGGIFGGGGCHDKIGLVLGVFSM